MRLFLAIIITWSIRFVFVAPYPNDNARNGNSLAGRVEPRSPFEEYDPDADGEPAAHEPKIPQAHEQPGQLTQEAIKASLPDEPANHETMFLRILTVDPVRGSSAIVEPSEGRQVVRFVIGPQDMPIAWQSGRRFGDGSLAQEFTFPIADAERNSVRQKALENSGDDGAAKGPNEEPVVRPDELWDTLVSETRDGMPLEKLRHDYYIGRATKLAIEKGVPLVIVLPGKSKGSVHTTFFRLARLLAPKRPSNMPVNEYVQPKYTDAQKRIAIHSRRVGTTVGKWKANRILVDPNDPKAPRTLPRNIGKRETSVLSQLGPASGSISNGKSATNLGAQSEVYWEAFQVIQNNISDAIFPFLKDMVNGSNSSVVYNAAWSIWTDLTMANQYVSGPFNNGLHQFDALEDQYANANKLNTTNPAYLNVLAVNAVLIDLYQTAWNRSVAAINATGLLDLRDRVAALLIQTNSTSIQLAASDYDNEFFVTYNS